MAEKIFNVDKFLGINEAADGTTELKLGEASRIENFYITDDYNLESRPGAATVVQYTENEKILALWDGYIGKYHFTVMVTDSYYGQRHLQFIARNEAAKALEMEGDRYVIYINSDFPVRFFSYGRKLFLVGASWFAYAFGESAPVLPYYVEFYDDGSGKLINRNPDPYIPVVYTTCSPTGKGEERERINCIPRSTESRTEEPYEFLARLQFSGDGESTRYNLPMLGQSQTIKTVKVDGVELVKNSDFNSLKEYERTDTENPDNTQTGLTCTFTTAPPKGVNNVEMLVSYDGADHRETAKRLVMMQYSEVYNGATDSRLFFYGDGTNICYYTGTPAFGEGLYIPAGNEIAVDSSASAITALRRQNSQLLAFKPDGAFSIDYEPVTLDDGKVIAGFYVRPLHRSIGNEMANQVQTVNNYARTLSGGALYEWRSATAYHDERYAKRVSDKVARTLAAADPGKIVTCDDNSTQTYYMFLNDENGTVLVNRYALDAWTVYTGEVFRTVSFAAASQGDVLFTSGNALFRLDNAAAVDAPLEEGGENRPIECRWESGFMDFGAANLRKHSSRLWISLLPQASSSLEVTVQTDKRKDYLVKTISNALLDFTCVDFSNFAFLTYDAPKIKRVQLKVKKFVYYKLILRVLKPAARATVLGYSQQVRYSSSVK